MARQFWLSDAQWVVIEPLLVAARNDGRPDAQ